MAEVHLVWLLLSALVTNVPLGSSLSIGESKLASFLLNSSRYSADVRPVRKYEDKLIVRHGLTLAQLIKLDEKSQIITTRVVVKMKWDDFLLKWNPSDYDGITEINVDVNLIWIPQIQLFNNADDSLDVIAIPRAIVKYNGTVTAMFPRIFKSTCDINVRDFPFDQQICDLKFGSFQFNTQHMDLYPLSDKVKSLVGIAKYEVNGEWDLMDERIVRGTVYHAFSNDTVFSELSYKLLLRRKPLYYIANFVIPCVLIALVTILLFLIPPDTGEQMAVGVTILLSMAVFFLLLEDKMPETSDVVPLIGKYFACTIVQISLAVGATCMMLCFHHHDATEVPFWMKKYILIKLAWLLRIKTTENGVYGGGRRGTVPHRLMKSNRPLRRTDSFATEIGRKHLLIWQAKARAKRLRREKGEEGQMDMVSTIANESIGKIQGGKFKVVESIKQSSKEKVSPVGIKSQDGKTIKQMEQKQNISKEQQKTQNKPGENLRNKHSSSESNEIKENENIRESKGEELDKKKQQKENRKPDGKVREVKQSGTEGRNDKVECIKKDKETGKDDEVKIQKKKKSTPVLKEDEKLVEEQDGECKQRIKRNDKNQRKSIEDISENESKKEKMEIREKEEQNVKEVKTDKKEKKGKNVEEDKVKDEETRDKSHKDDNKEKAKEKERKEEINPTRSKVNENKGDKERDRKTKDSKERKDSGDEKKETKDLQEKKTEMVDKGKEKSPQQSKGKQEKRKDSKGTEQKAASEKGNSESIEKLKPESKKDQESQNKPRDKKKTTIKAGTWIKLDSKDEKKVSKHKDESVLLKESREKVGNTNVKSTASSRKKLQKQRSNVQSLKIDDIEDTPADEDQQQQENGCLDVDRKKMDPNVKLTPVEHFNNAQEGTNDDTDSISSKRNGDDDTRILMPSSKPSKVRRRPAAKQFKLVDRVLRIKESLTQRLQSSNTANKQEQITIPQQTALQRSAKKIENAANWAEAEHESVKLMAHKIQETESADKLKGKWKEVGKVLNNLLMWMYIISIVLAFFIFFGPVFVGNSKTI